VAFTWYCFDLQSQNKDCNATELLVCGTVLVQVCDMEEVQCGDEFDTRGKGFNLAGDFEVQTKTLRHALPLISNRHIEGRAERVLSRTRTNVR
jgi:hypothetical protein